MFTAALFTVAKIWKKPVFINRWMDDVYMYQQIYISGTYIQWNTTQPWKEWKFAICINMDGLGGYYAKWNKSDREKQITYIITYMESKSKTN